MNVKTSDYCDIRDVSEWSLVSPSGDVVFWLLILKSNQNLSLQCQSQEDMNTANVRNFNGILHVQTGGPFLMGSPEYIIISMKRKLLGHFLPFPMMVSAMGKSFYMKIDFLLIGGQINLENAEILH